MTTIPQRNLYASSAFTERHTDLCPFLRQMDIEEISEHVRERARIDNKVKELNQARNYYPSYIFGILGSGTLITVCSTIARFSCDTTEKVATIALSSIGGSMLTISMAWYLHVREPKDLKRNLAKEKLGIYPDRAERLEQKVRQIGQKIASFNGSESPETLKQLQLAKEYFLRSLDQYVASVLSINVQSRPEI